MKTGRPKATSLHGRQFGYLFVISEVPSTDKSNRKWLCECACGNISSVNQSSLVCGRTKSCGCLSIKLTKARLTTHGDTINKKSSEYTTWQGMIKRCTNQNDPVFFRYGMRGIQVCERWLHSFENFIADMGRKPSSKHSIDRINNDGNYEPSNCRWATRKEQNRNYSRNVWIEYNGERKIIAEWAEQLEIKYSTLWSKLKHQSLSEIIESLK